MKKENNMLNKEQLTKYLAFVEVVAELGDAVDRYYSYV